MEEHLEAGGSGSTNRDPTKSSQEPYQGLGTAKGSVGALQRANSQVRTSQPKNSHVTKGTLLSREKASDRQLEVDRRSLGRDLASQDEALAYSASITTTMDEMDPSRAEVELATDQTQFRYLRALEETISNIEFSAYLAMRGEESTFEHQPFEDRSPHDRDIQNPVERGEKSTTSAADTASKRQRQALALFVQKVKLKNKRKAVAARDKIARDARSRSAWERWEAWNAGTEPAGPEEGGSPEPEAAEGANLAGACFGVQPDLMDLPSWLERHDNLSSNFLGAGYQATISSYLASGARQAHEDEIAKCRNLTHKQRRELERTRRDLQAEEDDEDLYMTFNAFDVNKAKANMQKMQRLSATKEGIPEDKMKTLSSSLPRSKIVSKDYFTIVDSGTTISITPDEAELDNMNDLDYVKIMGFNGSTTRSRGSGNIFGFARSAEGRRVVPLRIPNAHHVPTAPERLMSVSAMVLQGYSFHFAGERSYVVTPGGDELDLLQRSGMYWLKWRRAISPMSERLSREPSPRDGIHHDRRSAQPKGTARRPSSEELPRGLEPADDAAYLVTTDLPDKADMHSAVTLQRCTEAKCECCNLGRVRGNAVPLELLHRRLAHCNGESLKKMVKHRAIDLTLTDRELPTCDVCRTAKATRRHVADEREDLADQTKPFQRVWTDLKGKVSKDFFGNQHIVTFTCEVSRWSCVYFIKRKSDAKKAYVEFLQWVSLRGYKVELLNSDGGGEYTASENAKVISEFQEISLKNGVTQNFTAPYTPEMNGISERLNRTIVENTRAVLIEAGLSREFWSLAARHVVYLRNRLWHSKLQTSVDVGASPFQIVYGKAPKLANARVWGCDAWKLDHMHKSGSFERKAKKMIFVGLSANRKGWVLFDPATRKTSTTYHCTFDEDMSNRRCALRDFDLRPRKAGAGATADEERLAVLERSLYEDDAVIDYDEPKVQRQSTEEAHRTQQSLESDAGEPPPQGGGIRPPILDETQGDSDEDSAPKGARPRSGLLGGTPRPSTRGGGIRPPTLDEKHDDSDEDPAPQGAPRQRGRAPRQESLPDRQIGGRSRSRSADQFVIPQRRAAIGAPQDLDDEEKDFLKIAFELNLPMLMQQRNPKAQRSTSRARYEKYKGGKTLREVKRLGAEWKDIVWDYSRGFIDFSPAAASNAVLEDLVDAYEHRDIDMSAAAYVDASGIVNTSDHFNHMTLEESIQQDYAQMAFEHIESMPHRAQRLLQRALGNETLERFAHCCAARIMVPEPLSVTEAMASEHAAEWRAAMKEEIDTLSKFGCFEQVPRSEALKHGKLVKAKWVFKVKYESDNSIQRFKCRLVAKGFTQVEGTDFYETFSPVFGYSSLRTLMADAAARDFQLDQWDLKSSFIQQELDVDHMYMECPEGYDKFTPDGQRAALHCRRSIYGLKQSSRLLHERLSKYLIKLGFRQLVSDRCVFTRGEGDDQCIVCTWVDDIIMSSARGNAKAREDFDRDLRKEFEMSPWTVGVCDWILNMTVKRDFENGILHLSQPQAIEKLATKFGLTGQEGRAPHVPMDPLLKLDKPADEDIVPYSTWDYRSAVGGLLYLSITARPDIAQAVGVLSRFMSYPGAEHVEAAKRVIKYVYSTKDYGITYRRAGSNSPHKVAAQDLHAFVHTRKNQTAIDGSRESSHILGTYCDADYAGDVGTRKSTGGYGMLLSGGLICWSSKLQPTVALSTAEAETMAGVEAVKQVMYLRLFLQELGCEQHGPSLVYEDNNAAISIAHGKEQSKRSKHYQVKVHFLNEAHQNGVFAYEKVPTKLMLADTFTKALPREDFCRYRDWMGVGSAPDVSSRT